ncbi:tripeptidyl-peptidase II Tpp2 [Schizosaccharomyces cryophilus OY26]|uniref:Tripeptidyl-peptidase 2 n=1 Tax=Schizosaccharomyces cryophilus (strain OY26 / ATCC MYA-4695 / CBS 11777 / NBRC 106824 / NRRL Y48691) TaxID=653667 RepID=S9VZR4_SCHCR|nr:tripeptidyl-peptidase II Tpp2 [Schizosaccharomyces cryophilus OY26]EPY53178.1 tripeptidyl-peptidase II Tpp2 [Schizosaccharomyces cryophilus OY26]
MQFSKIAKPSFIASRRFCEIRLHIKKAPQTILSSTKPSIRPCKSQSLCFFRQYNTSMIPSDFSSNYFPFDGVVPKHETQAYEFLKKYPEYDGRGVTVGILDTGVDPGAPGLSVTSTGQAKFKNVVDCTGAGDVDTSLEVESLDNATSNEYITVQGRSGRTLKLSKEWKNPTKKWRVGCKLGYDFFPSDLRERLQGLETEDMNKNNRKLLQDATEEYAKFKAENPETPTDKDKLLKLKELEARIECLKQFSDDFKKNGPLFDIITFHDGEHWQVVVDTSQSGDLVQQKPLRPFSVAQEWGTFGSKDLLSYGVHVYDNGNVTSIVAVSGTHGTHVAGIIGAHHPEKPDLNGAAPGCRLVSLMIGDGRLDSLETSHAFSRACTEIIKNEVDIINISFGEDAGVCDKGRVIELLRDELSGKRNVVIVSSAGNNGPAYTTVGAPGGTTTDVISVGAYVTGSMMQAQYSLLSNVRDTPYTWCSRGPTLDGDTGVSIYAPGGAITSVPPYSLQNSQLMNGTSMSSPSACGGISLILSALKAQNISYTASAVKKAVIYTSKDVRDDFDVGMLQVDAAYNYLTESDAEAASSRSFTIKGNIGNNKRGVYLREVTDLASPSRHTFSVAPKFEEGEEAAKSQFEVQISLAATQPWIQAPEYVMMAGTGRAIPVRVDPTALVPGFHFGKVKAFEATKDSRRCLFEIPVTVMKPSAVVNANFPLRNVSFEPTLIRRYFLVPPKGATYAEIRVKAISPLESSNMLWISTNQALPQTKLKDASTELIMSVSDNEVTTKLVPLHDTHTLELCMAQWWSSLEHMTLDIDINFHGIKVLNGSEITLHGNKGLERLDCISVRREKLKPEISFDKFTESYKSTESVIQPLGERDVLPDNQQLFELVNSYSLTVEEKSDLTADFSVPHNMYDNGFNGFFVMIFDSQKQRVHYGDMYTSSHSLEKGEYVYKVQLLSVDPIKLERFKNMTLKLSKKLKKSITLPIYSDHIDFCDNRKESFDRSVIEANIIKSFIVGTDFEEYPSEISDKSVLTGTLKFNDCDKASVPVYLIPSVKPVEKPSTSKESPNLVQLQVDLLSKLEGADKDKHLKYLQSTYKNSLEVQLAKLDAAKEDNERLSAADSILSLIDQEGLSRYYSSQKKVEDTIPKDTALEKNTSMQKDAFIKALEVKCSLYAKQPGKDTDSYSKSYQLLLNWLEDSDSRVSVIKKDYYKSLSQYGLALKALMKLINENGNSGKSDITKLLDEEKDLLQKLGWTYWYDVSYVDSVKRIPPYGYELF